MIIENKLRFGRELKGGTRGVPLAG